MTYVEGVGDEVVLTFAAFLLVVVIILVWISTSVNERAHRQVVILDRERFQRLLLRLGVPRRRGAIRRRVRTSHDQDGGQDETQDNSADNVDNDTAHQPNDPTTEAIRPENSEDQTAEESIQHTETPSLHSQQQEHSDSNDVISEAIGAQESNLNLEENETMGISQEKESANLANSHLSGEAPEAKEGDIETMRKLRMAYLERKTKTPDAVTDALNDVIPSNSSSILNEHQATVNLETQQSSNVADINDQSLNQEIRSSQSEILADQGQDTLAQNLATDQADNSAQPEMPARADPVQPEVTESADSTEPREGHIRVRIRFMDARQNIVHARPADTLSHFKRSHFAAELAENLRVRLIYRGQELRNEHQSLQACNIEDNSVVHCLLSAASENQPNSQHGGQQNNPAPVLDLGHLVFPLFGFMLAMVWYCRVEYRQYFNAMSTLSLLGISFLYVVALLANYAPRHQHHEHQD